MSDNDTGSLNSSGCFVFDIKVRAPSGRWMRTVRSGEAPKLESQEEELSRMGHMHDEILQVVDAYLWDYLSGIGSRV